MTEDKPIVPPLLRDARLKPYFDFDRVPAIVQPCPDEAERHAIEDALDGLPFTDATVDRLEKLIDSLAFRRAAECIRHVVLSLGKSPAAQALRRAMLSDGSSLADAARQSKCSRQAIHRAEKRITARLQVLTAVRIEKER